MLLDAISGSVYIFLGGMSQTPSKSMLHMLSVRVFRTLMFIAYHSTDSILTPNFPLLTPPLHIHVVNTSLNSICSYWFSYNYTPSYS